MEPSERLFTPNHHDYHVFPVETRFITSASALVLAGKGSGTGEDIPGVSLEDGKTPICGETGAEADVMESRLYEAFRP